MQRNRFIMGLSRKLNYKSINIPIQKKKQGSSQLRFPWTARGQRSPLLLNMTKLEAQCTLRPCGKASKSHSSRGLSGISNSVR